VVDDVESLRYVANMASIPLHVWASRCSSLDTPDWCILDLDPKSAEFAAVVQVAREVREVCDEMGVPSFPKTSGKSGLHVLIPMGAETTYTQQKLLGALIARLVDARRPDIATTIRTPSRRGDRVYIDHLQNGRGKLLVAPYSVRPVPGATVSAPLRWSEVVPGLDIGRFTIRSMPRRLAAMTGDPLAGVLTETADSRGGLSRLAASLDA
jgi:bifunctional non-homologous end joining protein LigD